MAAAPAPAPPRDRSGVDTAHLGLAGLLAALVLVMAVLAGRSDRLFGDWDITVHGILGNVIFTLVLVAAVLAFVRRTSVAVRAVILVMLVATFAQVGLGYVGRDSTEAASWHIPNGVLLMGLATAHFQLLLHRSSPSRPAR